MDLTHVMIRWSPGIHSEISPKKFHGRVQVFADLTHVMIWWSPGIHSEISPKKFHGRVQVFTCHYTVESGYKYNEISKSVYTRNGS